MATQAGRWTRTVFLLGLTAGGCDGGALQMMPVTGNPVCTGAACTKVSAVAAGHYHTCALMVDQTVRCWGNDYGGMLGVGSGSGSESHPTPVPDLSGVARIYADYTVTSAQMTDGSVRLWGGNNNGQLGNGSTGAVNNVPGPPLGFAVREMALGSYHSCALRSDGNVSCWGLNTNGQLGDGTTTDRHVPTPVVDLSGIKHVSAGAMHTCALRADDTVSCWGLYVGVMASGTGFGPNETRPVAMPDLTNAAQLTGGGNNHCALRRDGTVSCWGRNDHGQLGDGTIVGQDRPQPVPGLSDVRQIGSGDGHVCALLAAGTVSCWGSNKNGQLGDGTRDDRANPTAVPGLSDVVQISLGTSHSCAVTAGGELYCWGDEFAYIGGGPNGNRISPARIIF